MSQESTPPVKPASAEDLPDVPKGGGLGAHKGKLAIGVAATLGLMVYYKWRERQLAKDDPEDYARLKRVKAGVTHELDGSEGDSGSNSDHRDHIKKNRKEKSSGG